MPDGAVEVMAWGPGADWLVAHAPTLVGGQDDPTDFRPAHPLLRELHRRHPGLHICRTEAVFEAAMATIIEQKVPGKAAVRSWRAVVRILGDPAPGPLPGFFVPPAPELVVRTPYHAFHPFGLERHRAETLRRAAASAQRLAEAPDMPLDAARGRLDALPGLGPWSAAEIAAVALGDADAVPVGDYHLPHQVSWALAGEPRGSDERMLELLEPYRGHRGRVLRLLSAAGIQAPRYGPRLPLRDVAAM
jgi:3-methyladenine DNA glycosylase/8-oxoguanine DNA glycosylase